MNGEVVCQSPSVTILSCSKPLSRLHDEKTTLRLMQEDTCSPACLLQSDGKAPNAALKPDLADGQRSLRCPSDERLSSSQLQTCHRPPAELQLSTSSPCAPLHSSNNNNNNNSLQRRGARAKVMGKKSTRRTGGKNSQNRKVTDFYPIRRSSRKSKSELKCEQKKLLDDLITNGIEEGMEVQLIEGKGRAVFATRCFQKGDYVVEYHGDLLQITDAKEREAEYAQNPATGCYMYYFQYLCKTYCVDATKESGRMGRLINHSKTGNCQTKLHDINGVPHLILVASRDIDTGEELLYDYGDRSKASIDAHPWLKY